MTHDERVPCRRLGAWARMGGLAVFAAQAACGMPAPARSPAPEAVAMEATPAPVVVASPPPPPPPHVVASGSLAERARAPLGAKSLEAAPHTAAMLVYTAHLTMAVYHVTESMDAVRDLGDRAGGYLSLRSDTTVTVRVPRDRFEDTLTKIERIGDVLHRDLKAEDVTDEFVDTDARLRNARAMRNRLQELLQRAAVKDAIEIQRELGHVTEEIERLEGRLTVLRDQIAFSTITVAFEPVKDQAVHDTSLLAPFPWLQDLGLQSLLDVHQ